MLKVFKFGGASVKDAEAVRNVADIIKSSNCKKLVMVLSAMGKMTNAFEELVHSYVFEKHKLERKFSSIYNYHSDILEALFPDPDHPIYDRIMDIFSELRSNLRSELSDNYDYEYDRIVPFGEILSTTIVAHHLNDQGLRTKLLDARKLVRTDHNHRAADINWELTGEKISNTLNDGFWSDHSIALTQGFIGSTREFIPTTLGREGSDYTASIFAYVMNAKEVIIWKDVPGLLNADPKIFNQTVLLENISFQEAIELSYYGAKIIHPKTIKPLQNKNIPLRVKSFENPTEGGSLINDTTIGDTQEASVIVKENQTLVSLSTKDYSFIAENHLHTIYGILSNLRIQVNIIQNSAISFSLCFDYDKKKLEKLKMYLSEHFNFRYNDGLTLYTIRHYDEQTIKKYINTKMVLMEQRSRVTAQFILK